MSDTAREGTSADADMPFDLKNITWHGMEPERIGVEPTGFLEEESNAEGWRPPMVRGKLGRSRNHHVATRFPSRTLP